jgi:replicative superfamily II helicase
MNKQALIFVNSKRSAEANAERVAKVAHTNSAELEELAQKILSAASSPTKQCERLAKVVRMGHAFHHAGLLNDQRALLEDAFREGSIKTISATPTLCLAKGTKVWTGVDELPVEELSQKPLHVLDKNTLKQIQNEAVISKTNIDSMIKLSCASGRSIHATSNHKFYIKRNGKKLLVQLKNIRKTDKIATIGQLHIKEKTCRLNDFVKKYSCPKIYKIDTEIAYFTGLMLGDGYSGATIKNGNLVLKGSGCLVSHDTEIRDAAIDISKRFNLSYRTSKIRMECLKYIFQKQTGLENFLLDAEYVSQLISIYISDYKFCLKNK